MMAYQQSACPEPAHVDREVRSDPRADLHLLSLAEGYRERRWPLTRAAELKPTPLSDDFAVSRSQLW